LSGLLWVFKKNICFRNDIHSKSECLFRFFSGHFIFGGNNENKHEKLVAQTRTETKNVMVTGQTGGTVSWGSRKIFGSGLLCSGISTFIVSGYFVQKSEII